MSPNQELCYRSVLPRKVILISPGRNQTAETFTSKVRISGLLVTLKDVQDAIMNAGRVQAGLPRDIPMRVAPGL